MNFGKQLALGILCGVLAACAGQHKPELATYDLHGSRSVPLDQAPAPALSLRLESRMAAWFDNTDINYRLQYEAPLRLRQYADSRWAAKAGLLAGERLQAMVGPLAPGAKCSLRVEITEFAQHFDTPTSSRFVLEARWSISNAKGERLLAEARNFSVDAAPPDAIGGVQAAAQATGQLGEAMLAGAHLLNECK